MNKLEFAKLKNRDDMILAFNQLKDDYRQLFAINDDLQSKINKVTELIEKEELIKYFRETNDYELANKFEDLYEDLKEDK